MHCRNSLTLSQPDISEAGALTPSTEKLPRQAQVKSRFVETSVDPNSNVSVSVTQKEKEE